MKKLAAGIAVIALVMTAQFAFARDTTHATTQSGTAMTMTGDMCTGKTSASASSSADASAMAACSASASASSSTASASTTAVLKIKTKSNIKND